jgi:enoyl-CoA hydratase/carnithine racemase
MTEAWKVDVRIEERPQGRVAYIAIDHRAKLNCLSAGLMREFIAKMTVLAADVTLRAAVLTGGGDKSFVAGANMLELRDLDPVSARAFLTLVHGICKACRDFPVPVIARIQGPCFGAGLELAAACDMRLAADTAIFGMPEVKLGVPSVVEAALLPQLIGWGKTRWMVYTGENIDAPTALDWGLVEKVVPPGDLDDAVDAWVAAIVESGPRAMRLQKELVRSWESLPLNDAIQEGIRCMGKAYESDEPRRMVEEGLAKLKARKNSGGGKSDQ